MNIVLQIKSLLFSFIFGFFFSFITSFFYKLIYNNKKIIQLLSSLVLVLFGTIIYFLILKRINNATFHIYEIISIIAGYLLESIIFRMVAKRAK